MSISARRKLVVGATSLAVLAGSGGAYAAAAGKSGTPSKSPAPAKPADRATEEKAFLDDVAKRLNVSRDQLDTAIKGAAEARIDAAVAAGTLTKEQGEAAKQRLANGGPLLGPGLLGKRGGPGGPGRGPGPRGFGGIGIGEGAAAYLGLSEDKIREQLEAGKSLADIAKAQNKDVAGLKAALETELSKRLDEAVKDGHLTEAQKTKMLADADAHLDELINNTLPAGGPPWRHHRP